MKSLKIASCKLCRYSWRRYLLVIFVAVIFIYTYNSLEVEKFTAFESEQKYSRRIQEISYLINTSTCRIPDDDPFNDDIIDFVEEEKPYRCSKYDPLTYIDKTNGFPVLRINKTLLSKYSWLPISCCYSNITRVNYHVKVDDDIMYTTCVPFQDSVTLTYPYIKVICNTEFWNVYTNVHATAVPLPKRSKLSEKNPKFSVLLVGIDSMSKSNLKRTMPKSYQLLEKEMYSLKGYNKVGDNTFPNLMAFLTGYNLDQLLNDLCNTSVKMNTCQMIWDKFRESDYITAYGEDECWISTFNINRPGFSEEPTDFYYHPYFIASEALPVKKRHRMTYCSGPETSGERLINAAKDFAITFNETPSFGLFWANSFSHDNINMPAVMDEPISRFLSDFQFISALENTVFIFFSDHGFRFGDIRYTHSGWLEERLPFIYFYIPKNFQKLYPRKFENFLVNTERLTVPYDLFNTFQEILEMGDSTYKTNICKGCLKCSSLFDEIPENRTCEDAGIAQHWCTCKGHTSINSNTPIVQAIAKFIVNEVNYLIKSFPNGHLCSSYSLNKVRSAGISEPYINNKNHTVNYFLIMVETEPPAIFEATVEASVDNKKKFVLLGDISRIDRYDPVTDCINNGLVKKYCYCKTANT